ncbi:MAG: energy-coupling factor ABC transporter ATP-binding protein [Propioniciclava sp.]
MIEFENVGVAVPVPNADGRGWSSRTILEAINLSLAEQRVAFVGGNGSGKSTLLRLVNGLTAATTGRVLVDGLDPAQHGGRVRRRVGFVFTDPISQLVMPTPLEDVELSLRRAIGDRSARRRAALSILAERGLAERAEQSIYDLSGGERQLAALASVLAVEPAILVMDEPTTLLDLRNRHRFCATLATLPHQVLLATHDLDLAREADRVIVVEDGRIAADGPAAETVGFYISRQR